jgi:hypothetical protein
MPIREIQCPQIASPCQQLPTFALGQKTAFCALCSKNVHNLSAMDNSEQAALFATKADACIRYARLIPIAVLLISGANAVHAQDAATQNEELSEVVVTGGGRGPYLERVFMQSEVSQDAVLDDAAAGSKDNTAAPETQTLEAPHAQR